MKQSLNASVKQNSFQTEGLQVDAERLLEILLRCQATRNVGTGCATCVQKKQPNVRPEDLKAMAYGQDLPQDLLP